MTFGLLLLHLWGFVLPALAMALVMPWAGRWVMGPGSVSVLARTAIHAGMGVLVLLAGLWWSGQDGKMNTYIALVLVSATLEWLLHRGWSHK